LLHALRDHFDITVLARITETSDLDGVTSLEAMGVRVVTVRAPSRRSMVHRVWYRLVYGLRSLAFRRSLKSLYDCPGATRKAARELARKPFDLILLEYWQLYPLLDVFPPEKVILLTHDIDQLVNQREALLEKSLGRKIQRTRRWMVERREETNAYRRVHRVFTLTERDAQAVRTLAPATRVDLLPFGLPMEAATLQRRTSREVLFFGAMSAGFNRDAAVFFVREVYPHLEDHDLTVRFVGGQLPKCVESFGSRDCVHVIGRVDDVRPWFDRAACLAVPLRYGGGLRIRILEAMAAGVPVVCTPVAIAGMPFEAGTHYSCGRDGAELAECIDRLLSDPAAGLDLARAARERVEAIYGEESARNRLIHLFQSVGTEHAT